MLEVGTAGFTVDVRGTAIVLVSRVVDKGMLEVNSTSFTVDVTGTSTVLVGTAVDRGMLEVESMDDCSSAEVGMSDSVVISVGVIDVVNCMVLMIVSGSVLADVDFSLLESYSVDNSAMVEG